MKYEETLQNNFSTGKIPTANNFTNLIKSSCNTIIIKFKGNNDTLSATFIITLGYYYKNSISYQIPIKCVSFVTNNTIGDTVTYYYLDTSKDKTDFYQRLTSWFTTVTDSSTTEFIEPNIYNVQLTMNGFLNNLSKFFKNIFNEKSLL